MKRASATLVCLFLLSALIGSYLLALVAHPSLADSGDVYAYPCHIVVSSPDTSSPHGLSPSTIRAVYHLPSTGGAGTIAIVDAFDDPTVLNDLNTFSIQFGLPTPNFEKHMMASSIGFDSGWAEEISLDVQWAHAIAPNAKILLVEATSSLVWYGNGTAGPMLNAVDYARNRSDVVAISMSWHAGSSASEINYDSYFNSSFGATFFAASGDNAENATWPAASPNVVGVGGTTLNFRPDGSFANETVWNGNGGASGGGVSAIEPEPSYQVSFDIQGSNGHRGVPDVSYDADPVPGYPIYTNYSGQQWLTLGGTSAGTPQWAAIKSLGLLASNDRFYAIAKSVNYTSLFRDIINGTNGNYNATPGYDFCTGLGSPLTTIFHYLPSNPALSGPQTAFQNVWYTYTTNAVNDPDGGQIRYHLNATGPGTPYQNTTIWVNSGTPMSWNLMWEPTDNPGAYLIQVWVEDSYGMLSNMASLSVTMVVPRCALKTGTNGYFYVPNKSFVNATVLRVEMLLDNSQQSTNLTGDQTGGTSPYPAIANYPSKSVDGKDIARIQLKFGLSEGDPGWDYMVDVVADRKIDGKDVAIAALNFGNGGSYIYDLSEVSIAFNTGGNETPDANGFAPIPPSATSFNVTRNGTPIGAMIIFCGP